MSNLSEEEALTLVAVRGHCDDIDCWKQDPAHPGAWEIKCGVQDDRGTRHDQFIHLRVRRSPASGECLRFTFTLNRKTSFEQVRIYQLELVFDKAAPKNWHQSSHEHLGSTRYDKASEWNSWEYAHALAHFCKRTNLYLIPIPPSPPFFLKEKEHARKHH